MSRRFTHYKAFTDVYQEIAETTDEKTAITIYQLFRGRQIMFPQKLYSKEYIYHYIAKHYTGKNIRELSQMFNYSDRRIRQIISDIQNSNINKC